MRRRSRLVVLSETRKGGLRTQGGWKGITLIRSRVFRVQKQKARSARVSALADKTRTATTSLGIRPMKTQLEGLSLKAERTGTNERSERVEDPSQADCVLAAITEIPFRAV